MSMDDVYDGLQQMPFEGLGGKRVTYQALRVSSRDLFDSPEDADLVGIEVLRRICETLPAARDVYIARDVQQAHTRLGPRWRWCIEFGSRPLETPHEMTGRDRRTVLAPGLVEMPVPACRMEIRNADGLKRLMHTMFTGEDELPDAKPDRGPRN